jgi:hypothetical protein
MNRLRVTLGQLMLVVLFFGFGLAALRNANGFWASAAFSVAVISVSVALTGAFARKDRRRFSCAGFPAAGGARLVIWLLTPETVGKLNGPPRAILHQLQSSINPAASGGRIYIAFAQICNSLDVIILGLVAAVISQLVAAANDQPNH